MLEDSGPAVQTGNRCGDDPEASRWFTPPDWSAYKGAHEERPYRPPPARRGFFAAAPSTNHPWPPSRQRAGRPARP